MGDPPRVRQAWETTAKWEWGSLSLRAIAPRADRGELSLYDALFSTFWNHNKILAIAWRWGSVYAVVLYATRCWCALAADWCWIIHPYHILKLDPIWNSKMFLNNYYYCIVLRTDRNNFVADFELSKFKANLKQMIFFWRW